jgi:hypothetical protein
MLTIKNCRNGAGEDTGIVIGSFKLVDAGLCKRGEPLSILDTPQYSFHWSYASVVQPRRFKCYLEREPLGGKPTIYNFEIYDSGAVGGDSLIYAGCVGRVLIKDRIGFYIWMTNQILKHM